MFEITSIHVQGIHMTLSTEYKPPRTFASPFMHGVFDCSAVTKLINAADEAVGPATDTLTSLQLWRLYMGDFLRLRRSQGFAENFQQSAMPVSRRALLFACRWHARWWLQSLLPVYGGSPAAPCSQGWIVGVRHGLEPTALLSVVLR